MRDQALAQLDAAIAADEQSLVVNARLIDLMRGDKSEDGELRLLRLRRSLSDSRDTAYRNFSRIWWSLTDAERYSPPAEQLALPPAPSEAAAPQLFQPSSWFEGDR